MERKQFIKMISLGLDGIVAVYVIGQLIRMLLGWTPTNTATVLIILGAIHLQKFEGD